MPLINYNYFDSQGLYRQSIESGADQGDSCHHTNQLLLAAYWRKKLLNDDTLNQELVLHNITPKVTSFFFKDGEMVRHPDETKWYSDSGNFTRDQQTPLEMVLGYEGETEKLSTIYLKTFKRFGFYPNHKFNFTNQEKKWWRGELPDTLTPACFGRMVRSWAATKTGVTKALAYAFVFFNDIWLVANSLSQTLIYANQGFDYVDDNNHLLMLIHSRDVMPTPLSKLATILYFKLRPTNYGAHDPYVKLFSDDHLQSTYGALLWYWRTDSGDMIEMAYAYRPLIQWLYNDAFSKRWY